MSAGSIFDSETKSRFDGKIALIAIAAFLALAGAGYVAYRLSAPPPPDFAGIHAAEIKETVAFMLAQPSFSGEEFRQQLIGKGRLEKYR